MKRAFPISQSRSFPFLITQPTGSTGGGIEAGSSSNVQNCTVVGNKGDGISGSTGGAGVGSTDPWANFSF